MAHARFSAFLRISTLTLLLAGCSADSTGTEPEPAPRFVCSSQVLERLYLGSETPDGPVSDADWQEFLQKVVTTRFPAGLTVLEGHGQWLGADKKLVQEKSRIVEIIHEDDPIMDEAVEEVAAAYKERFQQEAVLVLKQKVDGCF